jgi:hypothetical protein
VVVPVSGDDWAETIQPGASAVLDKPGGVWIVGAKPSHLDNIKEGLETVLKTIAAFVKLRESVGGDKGIALELGFTNEGESAVRIVPGNVENESELAPGATTTIAAMDYCELRQLGGWP